MECAKEVTNLQYKKYHVYAHTSDILSNGLFRATYTVTNKEHQYLALSYIDAPEQKNACTKALNAAKKFIDSLKK
jgi:hypothetical protein